ncbi:MAG: DarT ssDNA thymidine ADP-ribosyltransferase family protein [Acholeplasma sp.]|nr:DarT ssDNA thymidine ADP-ribosyltransferase family protein [Acholeplasma sp.]
MRVNNRVRHKKYQLGTVISVSEDDFTVLFDEEIDGKDTRDFPKESIYSHFEQVDEDAFVELLSNNGCEGLFHMTDINNLKRIIKDGMLYSRLHPRNSSIIDSANPNVIQHTREEFKNYVRFYYKEKTPTYYNMEGILLEKTQGHIPIPCLLVFSLEATKLKHSRFSDGNASSIHTTTYDTVSSILDGQIYEIPWDKILSRGYYESIDFAEETRIRNAEYLIKDEVSLGFVKRIIFRSQCELDLALKTCPDLISYHIEHDFSYFNNAGFFSSRSRQTGYNIRLFFEHIVVSYFEKNVIIDLYSDVAYEILSKFKIVVSIINEAKEMINHENPVPSTHISPYKIILYSETRPLRVRIFIDDIRYYIWER